VQVNFPDTEVLPYPDWVFAICVLLSSVPVISIPLVAIYRLICCMSGRHSEDRLHNDPNPYANEGYVVES
jgi:hypothetical protein